VLIDALDDLFKIAAAVLEIVGGRQHLALGGGNGRLYGTGGILLGVESHLLKTPLDKAYLVVIIIDTKLGVDADGLAVAAQETGADGVEGAEGQVLDGAADQMVQPFGHFPGGLIGEGHRHDAVGTDADHPDKIGDAVGNDPGLAAAGSSQNEHRPLNSLHGFSLGGIKLGEDIHTVNYSIYGGVEAKPLSYYKNPY